MKSKTQNSLLVEIMMAMLFFALSASVILQIYVTAGKQSDEAALMSRMLLAAQNLADETYLADRVEEQTVVCEGFSLTVSVREEPAEAGVIRRAVVTALNENAEAVLVLPCTRYIPDGEDAR